MASLGAIANDHVDSTMRVHPALGPSLLASAFLCG